MRKKKHNKILMDIYVTGPWRMSMNPERIHRRPKVNLGIDIDVGVANTGGGIERPGMDIRG